VTVTDLADGSGATVFVNGEALAVVTGAQGLSATDVTIERV